MKKSAYALAIAMVLFFIPPVSGQDNSKICFGDLIYKIDTNKTKVVKTSDACITVKHWENIDIVTTGGGGYGAPIERIVTFPDGRRMIVSTCSDKNHYSVIVDYLHNHEENPENKFSCVVNKDGSIHTLESWNDTDSSNVEIEDPCYVIPEKRGLKKFGKKISCMLDGDWGYAPISKNNPLITRYQKKADEIFLALK